MRVRDVIAHVYSYEDLGLVALVRRIAAGRFNGDRVNDLGVTAYAAHSPFNLLARPRQHRQPTGCRSTPCTSRPPPGPPAYYPAPPSPNSAASPSANQSKADSHPNCASATLPTSNNLSGDHRLGHDHVDGGCTSSTGSTFSPSDREPPLNLLVTAVAALRMRAHLEHEGQIVLRPDPALDTDGARKVGDDLRLSDTRQARDHGIDPNDLGIADPS